MLATRYGKADSGMLADSILIRISPYGLTDNAAPMITKYEVVDNANSDKLCFPFFLLCLSSIFSRRRVPKGYDSSYLITIPQISRW